MGGKIGRVVLWSYASFLFWWALLTDRHLLIIYDMQPICGSELLRSKILKNVLQFTLKNVAVSYVGSDPNQQKIFVQHSRKALAQVPHIGTQPSNTLHWYNPIKTAPHSLVLWKTKFRECIQNRCLQSVWCDNVLFAFNWHFSKHRNKEQTHIKRQMSSWFSFHQVWNTMNTDCM